MQFSIPTSIPSSVQNFWFVFVLSHLSRIPEGEEDAEKKNKSHFGRLSSSVSTLNTKCMCDIVVARFHSIESYRIVLRTFYSFFFMQSFFVRDRGRLRKMNVSLYDSRIYIYIYRVYVFSAIFHSISILSPATQKQFVST